MNQYLRRKRRILGIMLIFVLIVSSCSKRQKKTSGEGTSVTPEVTTEITIEPTKEVEPTQNIEEETGTTPFMTKEEFPIIDGSTANIPLGEAVYTYITGATEEEAKNDLKFYKTSEAYQRLVNGESDLLMVYEPSKEILDEIKESNVELEFKSLGKDALVFITNEGNPVNSLSQQQIIDIYTGKITNWSEVGGKDIKILPFQRPVKSGSQTLMEKLAVGSDIIMNGPMVSRPTEMGDLIDVLALYNNESNALGYSVYFYAKNMYTKPGLKFVGIDGVMPSNESIQKGDYPYVNDFYAVIRKNEPEGTNTRRLFDWLTTNEAQKILMDVGYVPVVDLNEEAVNGKTPVSVYKNGTLKIPEDSYVVVHDTNDAGTFTGDILLNHNLEPVIHFEGKQVVTDADLLCKSDKLIKLQEQKLNEDVDDEYASVQFELYDLKNEKYVTNQPYDYIYEHNGGIYVAGLYSNGDGYLITIFNAKGNVVYKQEVNSALSFGYRILKDRIFIVYDRELQILDYEGTQIARKEICDGYFSVMYSDQNRVCDYATYCLNENESKILDRNGDFISGELFLSQSEFSGKGSELNITNVLLDEDGSILIAGYIDGTLIIADEKGNILHREICSIDSRFISLYDNLFAIYNRETDQYTYYNIKGEEIGNASREKIGMINDSIVLMQKEGFRTYNYHGEPYYDVKANDYCEDMFWGSESDTLAEVINYYVRQGEESVPYGSFKGIWNVEGYLYGEKYDDEHYILTNYSYDDPSRDNSMLVNGSGTIIYQGGLNETIQGLIIGDETYLYVQHGNYAGIKNLAGEYLYRQYAPRLVDD